MKRANPWIVLSATVVAAIGVGAQDENREEVEALEKRVTALEQYSQAQAKAAEALVKALDESDVQGFTYGINPGSRKVLLAGLKTSATAAQQAVPGAKPETPPAER